MMELYSILFLFFLRLPTSEPLINELALDHIFFFIGPTSEPLTMELEFRLDFCWTARNSDVRRSDAIMELVSLLVRLIEGFETAV